jgi:hypothetical protein
MRAKYIVLVALELSAVSNGNKHRCLARLELAVVRSLGRAANTRSRVVRDAGDLYLFSGDLERAATTGLAIG